MKDLKKITTIALTASVLVAIALLLTNKLNLNNITRLQWWGITFIYCFAITYINLIYFRIINQKFEWKNKGVQRVLVGGIGSVIVTIISYMLCEFIVTVIILEKQTSTQFITNQSFTAYVLPTLIAIIISLFFHAIYFYKIIQEKKVTEQKIIAGTASAKFAALKNQLDPHFLFNSLNVLTSLIEENPKMAQKFTTSLSKVYRYVLEQKNKELVSVTEELKFAKTYMTLLKLRFEDSIIFECPDQITNPEAKVVPLALQILLENTVKHNIVMPEKPLLIKIYEENNFLIVENNLQPKEIIKQSSGVGLGNIMQRYKILTKREFSVYRTKNSFIAKLPILTKQIKITDMTISQHAENSKELKYQRAKQQVEKIKAFHINVMCYCIVIPGLAFLNYFTTGFGFVWFLFPAIGWGLGLAFHAMDTFDYHPIFGKNWEKRKIKEFMHESKRE